MPSARIAASSGAPAGLGNGGAGGGRGDRVLRGTCGLGRDGIGRGLALWDPLLPVAARVRLGEPSPRWGSVRWVSAPRTLWDSGFLGLGCSELPRGAWEWRGLAWGLNPESEAEPLSCVWTVFGPEARGLAPQILLGTVLGSGSSSSVSCWAEPFAARPTPISRKAGAPRPSRGDSGSDPDLGDSAESLGGWVRAEVLRSALRNGACSCLYSQCHWEADREMELLLQVIMI